MVPAVVWRRRAAAFAALSAGLLETITVELALDAEHYFIGTHTLSGIRRTLKPFPEHHRSAYSRTGVWQCDGVPYALTGEAQGQGLAHGRPKLIQK